MLLKIDPAWAPTVNTAITVFATVGVALGSAFIAARKEILLARDRLQHEGRQKQREREELRIAEVREIYANCTHSLLLVMSGKFPNPANPRDEQAYAPTDAEREARAEALRWLGKLWAHSQNSPDQRSEAGSLLLQGQRLGAERMTAESLLNVVQALATIDPALRVPSTLPD